MTTTLQQPTRTYATLYRTVQQRVPSALERTPGPWAVAKPTWTEKRQSERLRYPLYAMIQEITLVPDDAVPARVFDFSAEGIGLLFKHEVEVDSILGVEVQTAAGKVECRIRVRVVHCTRRSAEHYLIGCSILGDSAVVD